MNYKNNIQLYMINNYQLMHHYMYYILKSIIYMISHIQLMYYCKRNIQQDNFINTRYSKDCIIMHMCYKLFNSKFSSNNKYNMMMGKHCKYYYLILSQVSYSRMMITLCSSRYKLLQITREQGRGIVLLNIISINYN